MDDQFMLLQQCMKKQKKIKKSVLKLKPTFYLYIQLWHLLNIYLKARINEFIFFKHYGFNVLNIHMRKQLSVKEFMVFKAIYEYDHKVFKVLLFLYWDLEKYLGNKDYGKDSLKTNNEKFNYISIRWKEKLIDDVFYEEQLASKKPLKFWAHIERKGIIEEIFKYEIYSKLNNLDTMHKNDNYISIYRWYKKYNDLLNMRYAYEIIDYGPPVKESYYKLYIEEWHREWVTDHKNYSIKKYKEKIWEINGALNALIVKWSKPE